MQFIAVNRAGRQSEALSTGTDQGGWEYLVHKVAELSKLKLAACWRDRHTPFRGSTLSIVDCRGRCLVRVRSVDEVELSVANPEFELRVRMLLEIMANCGLRREMFRDG